MKNKNWWLISLTMLLMLALSACEFPLPSQADHRGESIVFADNQNDATQDAELAMSVDNKTPRPSPTTIATLETPEATPAQRESSDNPTPEPTEAALESITPVTLGPDDFPEGFNPLTGQRVENPDLLRLPPALVSISNFPASARPQAGLNSSPLVFELAIGEGMTRFLAVFYGQFPEMVSGQTEGDLPNSPSSSNSPSGNDPSANVMPAAEGATVGPIRSGRLPYEGIRSSYSGFLVMASAYEGVAKTLSQATSIFGSDSDDINSAMIDVSQLKTLAESRAQTYPGSSFSLNGMLFSDTPPSGGETADRLWVFYSNLNQIQWQYDQETGRYVRYDIKTDSSGEFVMATDRLTGEPVSKENVIVLFADHDYRAPTLIDIDLINQPSRKALLFRDGEIHAIKWTSKFSTYEQETGLLRPIRFTDSEGNPVPLKPGQSWIHLVSLSSYHVESAISQAPFHPVIEQDQTGLWLVRYKGKY